MKIIFVADIHGIIDNLEVVIPYFDSFDKIVLLGDIFFCGESRRENHQYDPEYLRTLLVKYQEKTITVKGNTDEEEYPLITKINIANHDVYLTHGHYYNEENIDLKPSDILINGHTHIPTIKKEASILCLNPGSLSLPKQQIASFMIYSDNVFTIYDINHRIINKINI